MVTNLPPMSYISRAKNFFNQIIGTYMMESTFFGPIKEVALQVLGTRLDICVCFVRNNLYKHSNFRKNSVIVLFISLMSTNMWTFLDLLAIKLFILEV